MAETVAAIVNAFLLPGEAILSFIGWMAPEAEKIMRLDYGGTIYPVIFSLLAWTVFLVIGLLVLKFIKNLIWQTNALIHTIVYGVRNWVGSIKTSLLWKYRKLFPHKADSGQIVSQEEFDKLDIAVLRAFFKQGPDNAASAPDLAEKFTLRATQVQRRLDKLSQNQMLCSVMGSTNGYDNYRLTDSGLTFITMMQRQARSAVGAAHGRD